MLPGLGFSEIVVLAVLALLVVGPKDLPLMLRKLGQFTRKLQAMAQEFRAGFDELARQAELDELRKEVDALRRSNPLNVIREEADAIRREVTSPIERDLTTYDPTSAPEPEREPASSAAPEYEQQAAEPEAVAPEAEPVEQEAIDPEPPSRKEPAPADRS